MLDFILKDIAGLSSLIGPWPTERIMKRGESPRFRFAIGSDQRNLPMEKS
jgi:hypothetical protein